MADDAQKIWRYMDFAKFISLLANEALFFPCPCRFNDPFEGHRPRSDMEALSKMLQTAYNDLLAQKNQIENLQPGRDISLLEEAYEKLRKNLKDAHKIVNQRFGVSCWHKSEYESEAMWKLYSNSGQGIAIESTVKQLRDAVLNKYTIIIDSVRYYDFDKDQIDRGHKHYGLFQKRKAFEQEKELRAILLLEEKDYRNGTLVSCDLDILINNIYVFPFSDAYIKDDIEKICSGKIQIIDKRVIHSSLFNAPDYGIEIT